MGFDYQQFTAVCRMTRDPEAPKSFGARSVVRFGIAFTGERRKNDQGQWDDKSCFMDCEVWQGETGRKLVDLMNKFGKKGMRLHVVGTLKMDEWEDKNGGGKRRAIKMTVTDILFLDKAEDQGRGGDGDQSRNNSNDGGGYGSTDGAGGDPIPF